MLMWVKPEDGFGESLIRSIKRFLLICFIVGVWVGVAIAAWLGTMWITIKTILAPIIRIH